MSSSTAPITSSRGATDMTAGRIYFSTPSAQVRVPVGDLVFPPPPTSAHTILLMGEKFSGGRKIFRWRKNYPAREKQSGGGIIIPGGRGCPKNRKKNPKIVAQCRKYPIPNLYTLNRTIPYLYTLNRTIPYLYTLSRTIPYLNTLIRIIPYVNTMSRTIPYLYTLNRTIPYLYTLSRTIHYLNTLIRIIPYVNTLSRTIPYLITLIRIIPYLYTLSRTIPYLNTLSRTIPYLNTLIRIIPYVNTMSRTIPYLYTLNRTIPYLYTLNRTLPYLNTLSRFIPYVNTLSRTIPYLNTLRKNPNLAQNQILVGSQSESSTKKTLKPRQPIRIEYHTAETYPILIHCPNIPYLNTWVGDPSRPWARVGCYGLS